MQYAQSDAFLGASSGGGAAFYPAPPPAPRPAPAPSAPVLAAPQAPTPIPAAVPGDVRPSRAITITAAGGDVMELAAPPIHGTVALSGSGGVAPSLRYTPTPGYVGPDQFSLTLPGGRRTMTISITTASP